MTIKCVILLPAQLLAFVAIEVTVVLGNDMPGHASACSCRNADTSQTCMEWVQTTAPLNLAQLRYKYVHNMYMYNYVYVHVFMPHLYLVYCSNIFYTHAAASVS